MRCLKLVLVKKVIKNKNHIFRVNKNKMIMRNKIETKRNRNTLPT